MTIPKINDNIKTALENNRINTRSINQDASTSIVRQPSSGDIIEHPSSEISSDNVVPSCRDNVVPRSPVPPPTEQSNGNTETNRSILSGDNNFGEYPELLEELTIKQLLELAYKNQFPKKIFLIGETLKKYSPVLHFYTSIRKFTETESKKKVIDY